MKYSEVVDAARARLSAGPQWILLPYQADFRCEWRVAEDEDEAISQMQQRADVREVLQGDVLRITNRPPADPATPRADRPFGALGNYRDGLD